MKKLILFLYINVCLAVVSSLAYAGAGMGIGSEESCHNFSHEDWLPIYKICRTCHLSHDRDQKLEPLPWDKSVTSVSHSLYNSSWSSFTGGVRDISWTSPLTYKQSGMPDGLAKLCLGCHDGIIAPNVYRLHHFVSMEYNPTITELRNPDIKQIGNSGPIADVLDVGKVQCSSCHDVHDEEAAPDTRLLRAMKSELCLQCHRR